LQINPLKLLEKEYCLLILQYLHLNPNGRNLHQICSSIDHNTDVSAVNSCLSTLSDLGLIVVLRGKEELETVFALTSRGRYASEVVWDLFRIIINPQEPDEEGKSLLDFYK